MEFFELLSWMNMFMPYGFEPFTALWVSAVIAGALFAVLFALQAIALWTISGREGYRHRWMSFVPFLNTYYIGEVSDKNRFYNLPARAVSAALAVVELLLAAGFILYYVVAGMVYAGGLYDTVTQTSALTGQVLIVGYQASSGIRGTWLAWIFDNLLTILSYVQLLYILLNVLVVITFFQTYACRRYVLMSLGCVLFPVKGILMFAVRGNRGMNYRDYVRGEQRRRYEAYQQYSNQNGGNAYGGYNPYNGRPSAPPPGDPYEDPREGSGEDPFGGMGSSPSSSDRSARTEDKGRGSSQQPPEDPFGDL